ncbi:carboxypeptidase-like regulatory domain-containing protein [Gracilimonas sp. Q87]|uniref:TonB-dependent receptor n=1 Tax=Gracilimonas sp. Q87 TaxID=3384766 RepID=UPI003984160F
MRTFILLLSVIFFTQTVNAQSASKDKKLYSLTIRNVSIEDALIKLANISHIDFAYDSKIELQATVYIDERNQPVDKILKKILSFSNLDYVILSTGTYVITTSPNKSTQYGSLAGYVRDAETGEPLVNATIFIADATGATATNRNGYFNISSLLSGEYQIRATYIGYQSKQSRVVIGPDSEGLTVIELKPKSYMMEPLVVSSNSPVFGFKDKQNGTSYSTIEDNFIGADRNVVRSLKAFPGLSFSAGQQNFNIHGSDSRDHTVKLDGVSIYNSNIAGNTFGIFSPYAIDHISVSKTGFSADVGSSLSGFVDFSHDISDRKESISTLQADPYALNARLEMPFSSDSKLRAMSTIRFSTWGVYEPSELNDTFDQWNQLDPLLQNFIMGSSNDIAHYNSVVQDSDITFYDLHFALNRSGDFSSTKISAYLGKNFIDTRLLSERQNIVSQQPNYVFSEDKSNQNNAMINIEQSGILNARSDYWIKAYYTVSRFENDYRMIGNNTIANDGIDTETAFDYFADLNTLNDISINKNNISEYGLETEFTYNINTKSLLKIGLDPNIVTYDFTLSDLFYFPTTTSKTSYILSSFGQFTHNFNNQTKIQLGARTTYLPEKESFYYEPRFTVEYLTKETGTGYHSIKISTGIYHQFINRFDLASFGPSALVPSYKFWQANDQTTEVPKSYHTALSWSVSTSDAFMLNIETYYKWKPVNWRLNYHELNKPQVLPGNILEDQNSYFSKAEGFAYGGSLSTKFIFEDPKLIIDLTHQINISKERTEDRFNNEMVHSEWSEPYSLSSFINWRVFKNFNTLINLEWTPIRYWAYNKAYYDYLGIHGETIFGSFDLTSPENTTMPYYLRLDAGFNYSMMIGSRIQLETKIDLVNLLDRANPVFYTLSPNLQSVNNITYNRNSRTLPGFTPSLAIEISF